MPNIAQSLKDEMSRLARKEVKAATLVLKKDNAELKRTAAALKRRVDALERENKRIAKVTGETKLPGAAIKDEEVESLRITAKGVRSMRKRMRLSQAQLALLLGVSTQSVANWEGKEGKLQLRSLTKKALISLRGVGAREAQRRLEELQGPTEN